jgi:hypothetical protein
MIGAKQQRAPVLAHAPSGALFVVDFEKSLKRLFVLFALSAALFRSVKASRTIPV